MSGKTPPWTSVGPPTHAGMPVLSHIDPDMVRSIALSLPDRQSAAAILNAMGAPVFSNALGDHLRDDKVVSVDECLAGHLPMRRAAIVTEIREACIRIPTGITPTDLALLRHTGIDVPSALALVLAVDLASGGNRKMLELWSQSTPDRGAYGFALMTTRCPDGPRTISVESMWLGENVEWGMSGLLLTDMPHSVLIAAEGRALSDLVSHPVLDPFGHVAGAMTEWKDEPRVLVSVADPGIHLDITTIPEIAAVPTPSAFANPSVAERMQVRAEARAAQGGGW